MRHHAVTAAMGLLIAAALVPMSAAEAASGDPTGIWRKADQGERPGKIEVFWCGQSRKLLCAKIVWLQDPLDSKGRPLHDVRNENPSQRGRQILGLPIIRGMQPVGPNQWKGNIYNPEDGNTYSATLTLLSRNQINLKGCKAWLLCGERTWLRTTLPKPEPEEQIEASAEPEAPVKAASAEAPAAPPENPLSKAEIVATPAAEDADQPGYRFLNASASAGPATGLSGESVPSMFTMSQPVAAEVARAETGASPQSASAAAASPPAAQPATRSAAATPAAAPSKPRTLQATVSATPKPQATAPTAGAAIPADPQAGGAALPDETQTAETDVTEQPSLTRRQKRLLRRQGIPPEQGGLLPWLR